MGVSRSLIHLRCQVLVWAALLMLLSADSIRAQIIGDVVSVGFNMRGGGMSGRRVRIGTWTPVVVQLTLQGQTQFNGQLRVRQSDRDGDFCYDYQDVLLQVGADGTATRRYTLYALPAVGPDGAVDIAIELLNEDNEVVKMVSGGRRVSVLRPDPEPVVLADDEYLILYVATSMGKIACLSEMKRFSALRMINIAHITPEQIPDRWQGLEAVDCVVWDEADPDAITNKAEARLNALAEWARQGGQLVLATARHAAALQESEVFKPLLPVRVGALTRLKEADEFRTGWLDLPLGDVEYSEPIPLAQCTLRQGPGIRKVFPVPGSENRSPGIDTLIARRRVGRGSLVFVAASLRDLTSPRCPPDECDPSVFFRRLLEIRTTTRQDYPERMVYKDLESKIGFRAVGALYLVSAMLFVMAYIALATFGSWGFLKSRGWSRHNWTVFAVFAGFAGVVGISTAQYARGVGQKLNQLTIVDATAGTSEACAVAYFGLKTGTHSVLDLWLAEDYAQQPEPQPTSCFLRSLPSGRAMGEGRLTFTDPGTYELRPAKAELLRVPIRATLKQFEGRWQGHLTGGIDASVRIVPRSFDKSRKDLQEVSEPCFDAASRITNNLGVDLENCFIFQPTANRYMHGTVDVSPRASGIRSEIIVHHVGQLKDGETYKLVSLYQDANGKWLTWNRWYHSLLDWQNQWGKFARPLGPGFTPKGRTANVSQAHYEEVLLLLTALSEYDEMNSAIRRPYDQQPLIFSRERCRPLDLSDILTRDMILLVGFARNPGPVSFCTRSNPKRAYKKLVPEEAWTVYRIVIPVN